MMAISNPVFLILLQSINLKVIFNHKILEFYIILLFKHTHFWIDFLVLITVLICLQMYDGLFIKLK